MPPILVPSFAKRMATQILVIAKLNGKKDFGLRDFVCDIIRPSKNANVKDIQYQRCQWRRSSIFIVNCKHISNVVLIVDFEQANVCLVHIEKANIFEDKIGYIMRYALVKLNLCEQNLLTNSI